VGVRTDGQRLLADEHLVARIDFTGNRRTLFHHAAGGFRQAAGMGACL
jgi:hypothetical protein